MNFLLKSALLNRKPLVIGTTAVVIVGSVILYGIHPGHPDQTSLAKKESTDLIAVVGSLIVLPTDEQPIIATVTDPSKLQDQPFFIHAKKGDKVLIYNKARKALLYDPIAHKIIDVAPLSVGTPKE